MRIAVIGATGLLGHHAARATLERGHDLTVIHRRTSKLDKVDDLVFESAIADLDDSSSVRSALEGADAVINCAAYYPTVPRPWRDEVETATGQMKNFYDACADVQIGKVVYLGGAIALPGSPDGTPGHEGLEYSGPPKSTNPYVQVKWAMDSQAKEMAENGLPVTIGIPAMSFGEWDYGPTTGALLSGVANRTIPGYIEGNRNVVYAGDAGRGLALAAESGAAGERYLFTGTNVSMGDLVALMARVADVPMPRAIPLAVARMAGAAQGLRYRLLGGALPTVSKTAIAVMSSGQFLDGSKAREQLGYEAELDLEATIRRTLAWFREAGYVG